VLLGNPFHDYSKKVKGWVGRLILLLWFGERLPILGREVNENYRLLLKRLYDRRTLENQEFRKE
jgi:hypothetical protein